MINMHVIGLGGTGSWFMHLINSQQITDEYSHYLDQGVITLFDFDVIEFKNTLRQNFKNTQIGLHKVDGIEYKNTRNKCKIVRNRTKYIPKDVPDLVISCIDTIKGRVEIFIKIMSIAKKSNKRIVLIDSGNEDSYGQVAINVIEPNVVKTTKMYIDLLNRQQHEVRGGGNVSCVDFEEQTATINFHQAATIQYLLQYINIDRVEPNVIFTGSFLNASADVVVNRHSTILSKIKRNEK